MAALLCSAAGNVNAEDKIFWANELGNSLRVANLPGGTDVEILDGAALGSGPCGVAIDVTAGTSGTIYYADFFSNGIWARDLATDAVTSVIEGENGACGVAVNPATQTIYWATVTDGNIRALKLDDPLAEVQTLFGGQDGPAGVAIDPAGGKIYWSNASGGAIRQGNLDGSGSVQDIAFFESTPLGVALDLADGKIYWTNRDSNAIRRADLDDPSTPEYDPGTAETLLVAGFPGTPAGALDGPFGIAIDPDGGRFYWANWSGDTIWSAPIDGLTAPEQLGSGPYGDFPNFPVLLRAPAGIAAPTISGSAAVGSELTCSEGIWEPDQLGAFFYTAPHSLAYEWLLDGTAIAGAEGSVFTPTSPAIYSCRVTASNDAGSTAQTTTALTIRPTLSLAKFYDANADGDKDTTESAINGWKVEVDGFGTHLTPKTLSLNAGNYVVREFAPTQSNWVATTPKVVQQQLGAHDQTTVTFGNVCVGAGGGRDTGFWKNKSGQALVTAADLDALTSLNLRTKAGGNFTPAGFSSFANWIGKASSTNMAYSLSAQLAAMTLNVRHGMVDPGRLIQALGTLSDNPQGFATVGDVMAEANTELGAHAVVTGGSPFRTYQAALQDALFSANANKTFVQAAPCAFTFR